MQPADPSSTPEPNANPYAPPLAEEKRPLWDPTRSDQTLNPWLSLWTQPRATIRQIVDHDPGYMGVPLAALLGVATVLQGVADQAAAGSIDPLIGILGGLVGGVIAGLLMYAILPWLYSLAARWLGGVATLAEMRAAYVWGTYPMAAAIPLSLLMLFAADPLRASPRFNALFAVRALVQVVLGVWMTITLSKCIGEVNQFSAWRGYGAMMLAAVLVVAVVLAVVIAVVAACVAAFNIN